MIKHIKTTISSLFILGIFITTAFASAQDDKIGGQRIVGGSYVKANTYPWFTMLGFNYFFSFWRQGCGGALVSPEWVLTAAHCINDNIRNNGAGR